MLSLYEILKASKTGLAPDMWTALAGMNWGSADSGHEVKELTGIPPLSFTADGTPLLDYLISGNMSQTGTPTPSNPVDVNGVGVMTKNLFDKNTMTANAYLNSIDGHYLSSAGHSYSCIIKIKPNTSYRVKTASQAMRIAFFTQYPQPNDIPTAYYNHDAMGSYAPRAFIETSGNSDTYMVVFCYNNSWEYVDGKTVDEIMSTVMISEGAEMAVPYEPYGYKIPISNGQQTTNIYLGSTSSTRLIKKIVFDGTEDNWRITGTRRMGIPLIDLPQRITTPYCTHFIGTTVENYGNMGDGECSISVVSGSVREFGCYDSTITTLADFKTWLQQQYANGVPVTVWYVLATPETAAVNEPLMKIGDYADTLSMEQAGVQIPTLHGNTVIDVLTELKPSQMYIKYQK